MKLLHKLKIFLRANLKVRLRSTNSLTFAFTLLGIFLFIIMIMYVGYNLYREGSELLPYFAALNFWWVLGSFLMYSCALALALVIWLAMMMRLTGNKDIKRHIQVYCYTNLARRIPGPLLHVVGRAYLYRKDKIGIVPVSTASGLEFVLLVVSGLIAYSMLDLWNGLTYRSFILLLCIFFGLLLVHPHNLRWILQKLGQPVFGDILTYRDILLWLGLYVLIWFAGGLSLCCTVNALLPINFSQVVGIMAAWSLSGVLATIVVFLPSGLGLREITLSALLLPFMPSTFAVTIALLIRFLLTFYEMMWAFFVIWL